MRTQREEYFWNGSKININQKKKFSFFLKLCRNYSCLICNKKLFFHRFINYYILLNNVFYILHIFLIPNFIKANFKKDYRAK